MISLGIDIGGTGAKCVAFRDDGNQLALSYREYPNPPGKTDLEAEVLSRSVLEVIADCVAKLENRREVAAITVSSFGESFVPLNRAGKPLTDIIMYFANSESGEFDALVKRVGEEKFMRTARVLPDASYSLAKMIYTLSTAREPVWKFLPVASYIVYCLSGAAVTDVSLACRTLLYDVDARAWSQELLKESGILEEQLPEVLPTGSVAGTLSGAAAEALGLNRNVPVLIGAHDQIVNALACGVAAPGDGVDVSGTCECIAPVFAAPSADMDFVRSNFACVPYPGDIGYITYAYNISGGAVLKWVRDALAAYRKDEAVAKGKSIYDLMNEECAPRPGKLLVMPFLQGMGGTPDVDPNARGMIYGLDMNTRISDIYRAVLEGLSFEMAYNLERLEKFGVAPKQLNACGGGARSKVWLKIKADIWNREIHPVETEETGALGSAILGFSAVLNEVNPLVTAKSFVRLGQPVTPDPALRELYAEKYGTYCRFRKLVYGD